MPIVHFKGKVLPYDPSAFKIDVRDLPAVHWVEQANNQVMNITTKINESLIDIEFDVPIFDEQEFSALLMRAWDLARAAVDLCSFQLGWGLSVVIDTLVKPDGSTATILPKAENLAPFSTALQSSNPAVNNFDVCYRLLIVEPALFMAMNDLIVAITLPHHASVNCARMVEGLRVLMTSSNTPRAQAWSIFQTTLNIDRAYREYITDISTGPRHGDRAHIPGPTVNEVVKRSWIIMNRFLEYRKSGNHPLPLTQFPLLV